MPSQKKVHMEGKIPFRGGGGPTKSLVKVQKSRELIWGEGGSMTIFPFSFLNKTMTSSNEKNIINNGESITLQIIV